MVPPRRTGVVVAKPENFMDTFLDWEMEIGFTQRPQRFGTTKVNKRTQKDALLMGK